MTLAGNLNINPFEIFAQDVDEVIMLLNFYIELGNTKDKTIKQKSNGNIPDKNTRIRVNDKTASGGWF